jgi:hypothetical protein
MWAMETFWLKELFKYIPDQLFKAKEPAQECGEDMFLSFVAQKVGIHTFVYGHGRECNTRWSSIQAYEMGVHPNSMNATGGLKNGDVYLRQFMANGWRLLRECFISGRVRLENGQIHPNLPDRLEVYRMVADFEILSA